MRRLARVGGIALVALACGGGGGDGGNGPAAVASPPPVDPATRAAADAMTSQWSAPGTSPLFDTIALSPTGDVAISDGADRGTVVLLAGDTGAVLDTLTLGDCHTFEQTMVFVDAATIAVACRSGNSEHLALPGGAITPSDRPADRAYVALTAMEHRPSFPSVARRVGTSLVAVSAREGLWLYAATGGPPLRALSADPIVDIDATNDRVCALKRDGAVECFGTTLPAPSGYAAATATTATSARSAGELTGSIATHTGTRIVVDDTGGDVPSVGASGELSSFVETNLFGMHTTMWLVIADVTVAKVAGSGVSLDVTRDRFDMTKDGKSVDPYGTGTKIKLAWTARP